MEGYDLHTLIISTVISSLLGGGFGSYIMRLIMKNEAKEALKDDLQKIDSDIINEEIELFYSLCLIRRPFAAQAGSNRP